MKYLFLFLISLNLQAACENVASPGSIAFDKCVGNEIIQELMASKKTLSVPQRKAFIDQVFKIKFALESGWKDVALSYIDALPVDGTVITQSGVDAIKAKLQ